MNKILCFLVLLILASCSESDDLLKDNICISFDVRQCEGDPWSSQVDLNSGINTQIQQYTTFFDSIDVQTTEIKIDMNYHQMVCEACFICPEGPRVFLKIDSSDLSIIQTISPLNLQRFDCSVF